VTGEAEDVAVGVGHGGDQLAPADVGDALPHGRAGVGELLEPLVDVLDLPVGERPGHALGVAVGSSPKSSSPTL
jgi:hypothetical protein